MGGHQVDAALASEPCRHLGQGKLTGKFDAECLATREILNRVGDKWSVLVIVILGGGTNRFSELKRTIQGISQRMLTLTLRGLERDGLVKRTVLPTNPPRVDYELTPFGRTLLAPVAELAQWAQRHRPEVMRARGAFDRAALEGCQTIRRLRKYVQEGCGDAFSETSPDTFPRSRPPPDEPSTSWKSGAVHANTMASGH